MLLRALPPLAVSAVCLALAPGVRPSFAPAGGAPSAPVAAAARPSPAEFDHLARTHPVAMLEAAYRRAEAELRGYRAVMVKQERMGGRLYDAESIRVACRAEPFAVTMKWTAGGRTVMGSEVKATRYDAGAKNPLLVYRPRAILQKESAVDPRGDSARAAARVGIEEFGLTHAVRRTWLAWAEAERRGELATEYLGLQPLPDAGGRLCHAVRRTCRRPEIDPFLAGTPVEPVDPPVTVTAKNDADAFDAVTVWIDRETWEQVGTEQRRGGELVARYVFHVTDRNPTFDRDEFSPAALRK